MEIEKVKTKIKRRNRLCAIILAKKRNGNFSLRTRKIREKYIKNFTGFCTNCAFSSFSISRLIGFSDFEPSSYF